MTSEEKNTAVLVVGAGPVGLFCANELHRHGLSCRIIDKKSRLSEHSKALGIHVRTLDVMQDCGFINEIEAQGNPVTGAIFKTKGKPLFEIDFANIRSRRKALIDLPQNKTEALFSQGLHAKGIVVEWQNELVSMEQSQTGVAATVRDKDGQVEVIHANWLIACDGAHSTLRHLVQEVFSGSAYAQGWWLADVYIEWNQPQDKMMIYISEKGPLACFPLGENRYRIVMTAPPGFKGELGLNDIEQEFKQRSQDSFSLSNPLWITPFSIHHRQIQQYRHGRVFFAGDAAHIHSPMGGQGLNTGIQDIYNLIWKLALVEEGRAKDALLNSYNAERYPVGRNVLKKTDIMTRMILLKNPLLISLRNTLIRYLTSISFFKKAIANDLAELCISYDKSPIVIAQAPGCLLKAGAFIADFNLKNKTTMLEQSILSITQGTKHHLMLFQGLQQDYEMPLSQIATVVQQKMGHWLVVHLVNKSDFTDDFHFPSVFIDESEAIHRDFALEHSTAVLIRPDKYIGLVLSPVRLGRLFDAIRKMGLNIIPRQDG